MANKRASRFEEVDADETVAKPIKRPRESDNVADGKAENAGKKKKLKAEDGKAVPVEVPSKSQEKEKKKKKKEKKAEDSLKKDQKVDVVTKTITGGVITEDHKTGTGATAKKGDTVRMRYIGKLTNGKEFDKNVSGKPVSSYSFIYMAPLHMFYSLLSALGKGKSSKAGMRALLACRLTASES